MKKFLLLVVSLVAALAISAASASAADQTFVPVGSFGDQGPDGSTPVRHQRIAVDHATGNVYVADVQSDRVSVYSADGTSGTLLTSFGAGELDDPLGIAIDQDSGTVYVSHVAGVAKYDSDGAATPTFTRDMGFASISATGPLAFDQAADELLLADTAAELVRRYSAAGAVVSSFDGADGAGSPGAFAGLQDLAVDSTGDIVVVDSNGDPRTGVGESRVERFDSSGVWEAAMGPVARAATVAVVPETDQVIVSGNQDAVDRNERPTLRRFDAAGTDLGSLPTTDAFNYATVSGIAAADGATGRLFVATDVSAGGYVGQYGLTSIQIFDLVPAATVSISPATEVEPFSATVHGTVNPEGASTSYRFEISSDGGASWTAVDPDQDGDEAAGDGTTDVDVSQTLTGLTKNTEYHVRLVAHRGLAPTTSAPVAFTTADTPDPTVGISAATDVVATSAILHGTVNPQGGQPASYRFEVSPDEGASWTAVDPDEDGDEDAGDGSSDVTVEATADNLAPGVAYRARLVVTKGTIVVTSDGVQFTTPPVAPEITPRPTTGITRTSALLRAGIRTYNDATSYHFEYGPTTAYGQRLPLADDLDLAGAPGVSAVDRTVAGLIAGTTYHFRVVAENSAGITNGPDQTFTTEAALPATDPCPNAAARKQQNAEHLPDCRAYEQISPVEKGGQAVYFGGQSSAGMTGVSADGATAVFGSWGNFADAEGGMPLTYRSRRAPGGWTTEAVTPPPGVQRPDAINYSTFWELASLDLDVGITTSRDFFDPTDTNDQTDVYWVGADQEAELLSRGNGTERTVPGVLAGGASAVGVSGDGSHVLFQTLGPDSKLGPESAGHLAGRELYDRTNGVTHLINLTTDGTLIGSCGSTLGSFLGQTNARRRAISADSSRVFFQVPSPYGEGHPDCDLPDQLYMRVNNADTVHISASQRGTPDPGGTQNVNFEGASTDGSVVFFSSGEMLTDESAPGGGLYRYEVESGELELLIARGDQFPKIANVQKISEDGSTIYFWSPSVFAPGADPNAENLYVWHDGEVKWIASDPQYMLGDAGTPKEEDRRVSITPDGRYMYLSTRSVLTSAETGGHEQAYLYDADAGELICVSCDPAGQRPAGAEYRSSATFRGYDGRDQPISSDGEIVVFETGDRLLPRDTNLNRDVYRYRDGRLALITSGRGTIDNYLVGMDSSGDSILFVTPEPMVRADTDGGNGDLYVARVGGGFLESERSVPPACDGDGCQGGLAPTPHRAPLGSVLNRNEAESATPRKRCGAGKRRVVSRTGKARCVKRCGKGRKAVKAKGKTRCVLTEKAKRRKRAAARRATALPLDAWKAR